MYSLYNAVYHMRVYGVTDDTQKRIDERQTQGDAANLIEALRESARETARPLSEMRAERERDLAKKTSKNKKPPESNKMQKAT